VILNIYFTQEFSFLARRARGDRAEEKQRVLYGATQLVGSPQELELFRTHLGQHRINEIKFRDIANDLILASPVSVLTTKNRTGFPQLSGLLSRQTDRFAEQAGQFPAGGGDKGIPKRHVRKLVQAWGVARSQSDRQLKFAVLAALS
jgi:hypothetical protein